MINNPSLVVCTKILNETPIAAVSGADTKVFTCRPMFEPVDSEPDVNNTLIYFERPFCSVLIASTM